MIFIEYPYKNVFDQLNPPIPKKPNKLKFCIRFCKKKAVLSHL